MSMEGGLQRVIVGGVIAGLLDMAARAHGRQPLLGENVPGENAAGNFTELWQEPDHFRSQQSEQDRLDAEQDARDREEDRKDREQEKKEQAQEKLERQQELYDDGREDLDDDKYQQAEQKLNKLAQLGGPQTDAALYCKAYAQNPEPQTSTTLPTIAPLKPTP